MSRNTLRLSLLALSVGVAFAAQAQDQGSLRSQREAAAARLAAATGAAPEVAVNDVTGAARFVRIQRGAGKAKSLAAGRSAAPSDAAKQADSTQFLKDYAGLFGIGDVAKELAPARMFKDRQGGAHFAHAQVYRGLPVFGGELRTHYDAAGNITATTGTFIPGIAVDTTPTRTAEQAAQIAMKRSAADFGKPVKLTVASSKLMVYREGLAQGIEGANHLAYEVVVGNGIDVRDFIYVDAHTGKVIDKMTGIHDAKNRRAYDGQNQTTPGPNYPNNPFWVEGQAFPTGNAEADNMIAASSDIYDLFKTAFGRDSYDGNGATMLSVFNRGDACPNASWNGTLISFCPGTTTDDVTAHEWGHAYTEYTHGLVYHWQPGALNEAYSDIWGETVDRINGRGTDTPNAQRTDGACTVFTPALPKVTVSAPSNIAGVKDAGPAAWGPQTFTLNGTVAGVQIGSTAAACAALPAGSLNGLIAFIERGSCAFSIKAMNAQAAGAIGVIIGNNTGGNALLNMSDTPGQSSTLPSLSISQNDGTAIKSALAAGTVTVSLSRGGTGTDNSVRWLMGEDSTAFSGAIRDMYNPTCYSNPGKVSDKQYVCGPDTQAGDWGGVHTNSGVPNHGYALLVDGGNYNGQSIAGIGLTKAAHIYWRAQSVYQNRLSGFADHADALEQSCRDLTGVALTDLKTGALSGDVISTGDCSQVAKMALAVELRSPPTQCGFQPLLKKSPPPLCASGTATPLMSDNFENGRRGLKWVVSHSGNSAEFVPRDWAIVNNLPDGRAGAAMFAADLNIGTCQIGGNQAGVQRLDSPEITVPAGSVVPLRMAFDHWISTEAGWDGGNVKVSVNGGAWQLVTANNFVYNGYNALMASAAAGNDNPMAGQQAFTGSDAGSAKGSWGRSIINLAPYAAPGDKVKLRFELGNDCAQGTVGWYVDDLSVYRCTP